MIAGRGLLAALPAVALLAAAVPAVAPLAGCGGESSPEPAALPAWSPRLPPASVMGARRGLSPARGIVHLHSPLSHDACDGEPRADDGAVDEACLADLRAALCATRMDYAALTDHDDSMADEEFADLFLLRAGDSMVNATTARWACDDGGSVLVYAGGENALMPIMIDRHPAGTVAARHDAYNADSPAAVAVFREMGGLAWQAHTEQVPLDHMRELALDGLELYNLHANIDPDIREDYLGLERGAALRDVIEFAEQSDVGPEPDLALLSFLSPSEPALTTWDALLGEGMRISATAGTDAHQNTLPIELRDGERGDSYRRMLRWFSNVVSIDDPADPAAIEAAVAAGDMFVAFELFGTPVGFDVHADGGQLAVSVPTIYELDPALPTPTIRARVLAIDATGAREVATGDGPTLELAIDSAVVAYRVEVAIVPRHLGPYLGNLGPELAEREYVWVYSNPIYVD